MSNKQLGPQIIALHEQGKNYTEIMASLNCSKGTISYHLGVGQKVKTRKRQVINRQKEHPYTRKVENFLRTIPYGPRKAPLHKTRKLIQAKIETFFKDRSNKMSYRTPTFTVDDVVGKFGASPKCYLTGVPIDINQPRTYHFDHITPVAQGGQNTIDNLGICTRRANMAKSDMTLEEFLALCKQVLTHHSAISTGIEPV